MKRLRIHKAWGWGDWLIYGGGFAFSVLCAALLVGTLSRNDAGAPETFAPILAPVLWALITWRLYTVRRAFVDSIAWVTIEGISVITDDSHARDWLAVHRSDFDQHVDSRVVSWTDYFADHGDLRGEEKIGDFLNGMCVIVHWTDNPIEDKRHGVTAQGMFWPSEIHIRMPLTDPGAVFWALLDHELDHACLTAMGIEQSNVTQHQVMAQAGRI